MCHPISGFIDTSASKLKLLCVHPGSHSENQIILGLKLDGRERYSEFEWPQGQGLEVRNTDAVKAKELRAAILDEYSNREALVEYLRPQFEGKGNWLIDSVDDVARIPESVEGQIIVSPSVKKLILPQLRFLTGSIDASSATTFEVPLLVKSGSIDASSATTFEVPLLKEVSGYIDASSAKKQNS